MSLRLAPVTGARPFVKILGDGKYQSKTVYTDPNTTELDDINNKIFEIKKINHHPYLPEFSERHHGETLFFH